MILVVLITEISLYDTQIRYSYDQQSWMRIRTLECDAIQELTCHM